MKIKPETRKLAKANRNKDLGWLIEKHNNLVRQRIKFEELKIEGHHGLEQIILKIQKEIRRIGLSDHFIRPHEYKNNKSEIILSKAKNAIFPDGAPQGSSVSSRDALICRWLRENGYKIPSRPVISKYFNKNK